LPASWEPSFFSHFPARRLASGGGGVPGEGHHQGDGLLGGADGVGVWRVHHHDALAGRRWHIDGVDAHAAAHDHAQLARRFQKLGRHLGGAADDDAVRRAKGGF